MGILPNGNTAQTVSPKNDKPFSEAILTKRYETLKVGGATLLQAALYKYPNLSSPL